MGVSLWLSASASKQQNNYPEFFQLVTHYHLVHKTLAWSSHISSFSCCCCFFCPPHTHTHTICLCLRLTCAETLYKVELNQQKKCGYVLFKHNICEMFFTFQNKKWKKRITFRLDGSNCQLTTGFTKCLQIALQKYPWRWNEFYRD